MTVSSKGRSCVSGGRRVVAIGSSALLSVLPAWAGAEPLERQDDPSIIELRVPAACGGARLKERLGREARSGAVDHIRIAIEQQSSGYQLRVQTRHGRCEQDRLSYHLQSCEEAVELAVFTLHLLLDESERSRCDVSDADKVDLSADAPVGDGAVQIPPSGAPTGGDTLPLGASRLADDAAQQRTVGSVTTPDEEASVDESPHQFRPGGARWFISAGAAVSSQSTASGDVGTTAELGVGLSGVRLFAAGTWWLPTETDAPVPIAWSRVTVSSGVCQQLTREVRSSVAGTVRSPVQVAGCARGFMNWLSASSAAAQAGADLDGQWGALGVSLAGRLPVSQTMAVEFEPGVNYVPVVPVMRGAPERPPYEVSSWEFSLAIRLAWLALGSHAPARPMTAHAEHEVLW